MDIAFDGETFEMEDQRNWSDASFKTYCGSVLRPLPYKIAGGATVRQNITVTLSDAGGRTTIGAGERRPFAATIAGGAFPRVALAIEQGWLAPEDRASVVGASGVKLFQVRLGPRLDSEFVNRLAVGAKAVGAEIDLEIILPDNSDSAHVLAEIARAIRQAGLSPRRVLALPAAYLKSYQPSDPWPVGPGPSDCARAARMAFPDASIGSGMLTNFTEFNRCPPETGACDYVSHESTAIVHAADDRSVLETLEALPQIFSSARSLAAGNAYRLGLLAIGMRSNPYGDDVAANPEQGRRAMARIDPRQRGVFAAAWAVAAAAAAARGGVEAVALAAPCGPFGIVYSESAWRQPLFDSNSEAAVYPLFHVVRALAGLSGREQIVLDGLPAGVHGLGAVFAEGVRLVIAHAGDGDVEVNLPRAGHVRVLDANSFNEAVRDPRWLDEAPATFGRTLRLAPYATAFVALDA